MDEKKIGDIETRLKQLQGQIRKIGPVMRGSVTIMGKRHKQPYFSVSIGGKTRVAYLGEARAKMARKYSANYQKLLELVDEMTLLYMELFKAMGAEGSMSQEDDG